MVVTPEVVRLAEKPKISDLVTSPSSSLETMVVRLAEKPKISDSSAWDATAMRVASGKARGEAKKKDLRLARLSLVKRVVYVVRLAEKPTISDSDAGLSAVYTGQVVRLAEKPEISDIQHGMDAEHVGGRR